MGKFSDKSCKEIQNADFVFNNHFENLPFTRLDGYGAGQVPR
jgi:hypothetical protein